MQNSLERGRAMKSRSALIIAGMLMMVSLSCIMFINPTVVPPAATSTTIRTTLTPTPTSSLLNQIMPTSIVSGGILFQDNFDNPRSGWDVETLTDGSLGYIDGQYDIMSKKDGTALFGVAYQSFTDTLINVDTFQISGPENNHDVYGVLCRATYATKLHAYAFVISGDGLYGISKITDDGSISLTTGSAQNLINQGNASNHLIVGCVGDHLILWVNGTQIADYHDSTYTKGDIGLLAETDDETAMEARFDNLMVTEPTTLTPVKNTVLFQDDFSDTSSDWSVYSNNGNKVGYIDNTYEIKASQKGLFVWGIGPWYQDDFTINVDANLISGPENNEAIYGVYCRFTGSPVDITNKDYGYGYAFLIKADGHYAIMKLSESNTIFLQAWTSSSAIREGETQNHLAVRCQGGDFSFTVNDVKLVELHDGEYRMGYFALMASTMGKIPTTVQFDNFVETTP
jgi:hypothetical protein